MALKRLKSGDGRKHGLLKDWDAWFAQADKLYFRLLARLGNSPFEYHEVACVGFLASAAAMAGFVPLAEYEIEKQAKDDGEPRDGRADLWFGSDQRAYSFEFKRAYHAATSANLLKGLNDASKDVDSIGSDEYHYAAGGLIAWVRDVERLPVYQEFVESPDVDLAYQIGPEGEGGAFLYFKLLD